MLNFVNINSALLVEFFMSAFEGLLQDGMFFVNLEQLV